MQLEFRGNEIIIHKELSMLDESVLDFVDILARHNIKHVIVSGYVAILFGLDRMCDDVDILIQNTAFERFLKLWLELEKTYECLDTQDPIDAYNGYLRYHHAIRIAKKGSPVPNFHIKFVKNEIERLSLKYRRSVNLDNRILFISPIEIQIPYKLFQGSEKDVDDARFLFKLFRDELNMAMLDRFLTELEVPKDSVKKYLEDI